MALTRLVLNRLAVIVLGAYAIGMFAQTSCHQGSYGRPNAFDILGNLRALSAAMH